MAWRWFGVAVLWVGMAGCLNERKGGGEDTAEVDAEVDGDAEVPDADGADTDEVEDDTSDADSRDTSDGEVEVLEPVSCEAHEACNALLDAERRCPGECFAVRAPLRCEGEVRLGVCHRAIPIDPPNETLVFPDFEVRFVSVPELATIGETHTLELMLVNTSGAPLTLPLRWKDPQTWQIQDASWEGLSEVTLGAREGKTLSATITAQRQTVFAAGGDIIVTLVFGVSTDGVEERTEWVVEPRANVVFGEEQPIVCGGYHFPETWCEGDCTGRNIYYSARCCDEAFFPGASCCEDADCTGAGSCVQGKCVEQVPWLGSANGLPLGKLRVRMVLVDSHAHFEDPCANHYEDVKDEIDFAPIEDWYRDLARRRLGREVMEIQWIVTGGVETSDFLTGDNFWDNYSKQLDTWLGDRGCPMLERYDKLIVSTSTLDYWGFSGLYFDRGNMAVFNPYSPFLTAHEMAHSFGARDLYLDMGGTLTYPLDLMGNFLSDGALDGVAWAEMGFGDLDNSGVIDIVEFAARPERLAVSGATATLTTKGSIEIRWEFVGLEDGIEKRVVVPKYRFAWALANMDVEWQYAGRWKTMVIDQTMVDFEQVRADGAVTVTLGARHTFTGDDWRPVTLELAEPVVIPLTIEGGE